MAGRIPQDFIDDLLSRTDIVDIVDERVKLKRTGRNYSGLCPFHQEKTPSFSVDPDKQFYYCFGCGAGGNALGFVMEYERTEFPEAVELLARRLGLELPRQSEREVEQRDSNAPLYLLLEQAGQFFQQQLRQHPQRQRAVDYLLGRGLSGQIAKDFAIGFAPPGWDNLLQHCGADARQSALLDRAGMVILKEEDKRCYDRFRDRIMFPIHDMRGRVIAFGGRVLNEDKPKYLNSPETPVFHKNRELYGLYQARKANRNLERLLIVEGYMDVVALAQFGINNAVATLGTATSEYHLQRIFKMVSEVVFCFDGDKAGRQAAGRALETVLPLMDDGRQARFLFLPEGEDPDTMVRSEGSDAFGLRVRQAMPLSEFLFESLTASLDLTSGEGRARLSAQAQPLIDKIPGKTLAALMRQRLGELTGLDASFFQPGSVVEVQDHVAATRSIEPPPVYDDYGGYGEWDEVLPGRNFSPESPSRARKVAFKRPSGQGGLRPSSLVRLALIRLLRFPGLASQVDFETSEALAALGEAELTLLAQLIDQARRQPQLPSVLLVSQWRSSPHFDLLKSLAEQELLIQQPEQMRDEFKDCLQLLLKKAEDKRLDALKSRKPSQLSDEERRLLTKLLLNRAKRP